MIYANRFADRLSKVLDKALEHIDERMLMDDHPEWVSAVDVAIASIKAFEKTMDLMHDMVKVGKMSMDDVDKEIPYFCLKVENSIRAVDKIVNEYIGERIKLN